MKTHSADRRPLSRHATTSASDANRTASSPDSGIGQKVYLRHETSGQFAGSHGTP